MHNSHFEAKSLAFQTFANVLAGDVVFARTGATTGKSFLIRHAPRAIFASYLIRLRVGRDVLPEYFAAFCQSDLYWQQVNREMRGSAQAGVNSTLLGSLVLPVPDIAEQKHIAAILERADRLRRLRRYAVEMAENHLRSIFQQMFGDPMKLKENRDKKAFGQLLSADLRNGLSPSNNGKVNSQVLTLSAITGSSFDPRASKIAPFTAVPPKDKRVVATDFLICRGNGNLSLVGSAKFPLDDIPDCAFPDTIIAARFNPNLISREYIEEVWKTPQIRKQIEASARTTNGTHKINQVVLKEIQIPVPSLALQQKFSSIAVACQRTHRIHRESLRQAEHLFQTLLHRAFTSGL